MFDPPDLLTDAPLYEDALSDTPCDHRCEPMAPPTQGARGAAAAHTEADGMDDLCVAILTRALADLTDRQWRVRERAIYDVAQGGVDWAVDLLPISEEARQRIYQLLADQARCARLPR